MKNVNDIEVKDFIEVKPVSKEDKLAIDFAEWLGRGVTCMLKNGNWIYNGSLNAQTTQELLNEFKKI